MQEHKIIKLFVFLKYFFLGLVIVVGGLYFSLQSSLVEKFVLPYIEPIIKEKSGYDVHIGHFSFDLLGHLHLQDITVKNPDTTLHMHSFDMVYDIWKLFDKNIVIRDIALKDISLFAHLHPLVGQTQPQTKQENNTTFSLQQILPLPFAFELEHFTIEPVHIDVDFSDATKQAHYKGDMYLKSAVLLENAKLSQRVVFDINNTSLSVIQHQKDQNVSLSLRDLALFFQVYGKSNLFEPLKSHLQWNFKQDMKNLSLALEQNQTNIKLTPLHLQLYLDGGFKESLVKNNLKLSLFPFRVQGRKDTLSFVATPSYFGDFNTTIGVEKQDKNFKFQPLQVAMQQDISTQNVTIKNNKQNLSFKKEQWKLTGGFIHHHINVGSKLSIYHLNTPLIQKQTTIHNKFAITTDTKLKKANITTALNVDSLSLIDFALVVKNQPKTLLLFPKIKLFVPQSLQQYKKELKALQQVGDIDMDIQGDIQIHHNKNKLLDVNWSNQSTMPIQMDMTLTLHQQSKPKKGELKIQGPLVVRVVASRDKAYQTQLYLKSFDGVFYPPLQKPLPFDIWVQSSFDTTLRDIKSKGNIGINHQKFFAYDMAFLDKAYDFRLYLQSSLQTKTQWQAFLSQLQPLSKVGDINLESTLDVNLTHPLQTVQKLTKKDINTIGAKVQFDGVVQQKGTTQETLLFLQKPLAFSQNVQWHKGGMAFRGDYDIASLAIKKQLALQKVKLHMDIKADDGLHPHTVWAKIQGDGDGLKITQNKPLQLAPYIFPFGFDGKVHQNNNDIALQNVAFSFGDKLLEQTLHGMFSLDSKNLSMDGNTSIHLRKDLFGLGTFTNLWKVSFLQSKLFVLQDDMMFHHLSVYGKDFSLKDINGKITLNEEMNIYKDGNVSFNYLLKTNPFQRVDFSRIEPYLTTQEKLSIQKIKVKNITAGPLQAVVPIEQNVIRLQQFDMKLFGGNVAGQLYLDTTPKDWKFGVLMRVSRVDLRELLQDKNKFKASLVSARVALEFSFAKRLLQGQIDITKISQSQLLQLLEIMDPQHKEAQLNKVRELLRYAYPKAVSIDMESGLLNLSISLSVLDNPIVIRGLPLSPLIERFSFDALQKIDKLPLTKEQK